MTTISMSSQVAAPAYESVTSKAATASTTLKDAQFLGRLTGLMFLVTYATSIPPVLTFYVPALKDPAFILGGGFDTNISWGALLESLLIVANIATALALYPVLKRRFPVLSLGFVAARLTESGFIAVGIIAMMALNTLRLQAGDANPDALLAVGQSLVAIHDWTFRLGPGVVVGVGNGLILGYMMWKTRLVPRFLSVLGLIGGPALLVAGVAVLFGTIEAGSGPQIIATVPEFFWELLLGIWLLVRGFNPQALAALEAEQA
jgi:hypothetical protein